MFNTPGFFSLPSTSTPLPNGCQSLISTNLTVLPNSMTTLPPQTTCVGTPVVIGGQTITTPGPGSVTIPNWQMCDSVINYNLTVLDPIAVVIPPTDIITCNNQTVTLNGSTLSTIGPGVTYSWTGPTPGCFVGTPNTANVTVNCPGLYTLIVTQTENGVTCTSSPSAPVTVCLLYTSPSPRDATLSRMPSSA